MSRASIRFGYTLGRRAGLPYADATVRETGGHTVHVKRFYGLTESHAFNRYLAWTRSMGDPR